MTEQEKQRLTETNVLITGRLQALHEDVSDLKDSFKESMKEMSGAVTKLVQIEERQSSVVRNIERCLEESIETRKDVKELDRRIRSVEQEVPQSRQTSKWVEYGILALLSILGTLLVKNIK